MAAGPPEAAPWGVGDAMGCAGPRPSMRSPAIHEVIRAWEFPPCMGVPGSPPEQPAPESPRPLRLELPAEVLDALALLVRPGPLRLRSLPLALQLRA